MLLDGQAVSGSEGEGSPVAQPGQEQFPGQERREAGGQEIAVAILAECPNSATQPDVQEGKGVFGEPALLATCS